VGEVVDLERARYIRRVEKAAAAIRERLKELDAQKDEAPHSVTVFRATVERQLGSDPIASHRDWLESKLAILEASKLARLRGEDGA
jgi:hypothetical protein